MNAAIRLACALVILTPCSASAQPSPVRLQQAPAPQAEEPERRYVWSGLGAAPFPQPPEQIEAAARDELADVRVALEVHRDFPQALARLAELRLRVTGAGAARWELALDAALLQAEVLQRLGRVREAKAALAHLLPDAEACSQKQGWVFEVAGKQDLLAEVEHLRDPRVVRLLELLEQGGSGDPGPEGIEQAVRQAFELQQPGLVYDIGPRAVPALEQMILGDPNHFPSEVQIDPLAVLLSISELRGAKLIERNYDAGGFFWKKRAVRAMEETTVLSNDGTWQPTHDWNDAPRLLEAGWLPILGRMVHDPQIGRDAIRLVGQVAYYDALSPELQQGLILALRSPDPDMVREVLQVLQGTQGKRSAEPVLVAALEHPDPEVRRFAAEHLLNFDPSPGLFSATESPDPLVRRMAARALRRRDVVMPYFYAGHAMHYSNVSPQLGEVERAALLELLGDPDPAVRREAMLTLVTAPAGQVDAELWVALAGDPDPRVRALAARLQFPDIAVEVAVLTSLAADPDPAVVRAVDLRLGELGKGRDPGRRLEPFLPVLAERRVNPAAPMSANLDDDRLEKIYAAAVGSDAGLTRTARWALEEGDDELLLLLVERAPWRTEKARGSNVGMGTLSDDELVGVLRRAFELSSEHFEHAHEEMLELQPRRDRAMLALARDASAPRELRVAALEMAAGGGGAELERELQALLLEASWQERAPNDNESDLLWSIGRYLPSGESAGVALRIARNADLSDEAGLRVVSGASSARAGGLDAEAAAAVLDRWYHHPAADYAVRKALSHLQAQPGDRYSQLLREAVRHPQYYLSAIEAMGRLGHPEYVPTLGACLRADWIPELDDRDEVQGAAIEALVGYLNDEAAEVLLEGLGWIQNEETREYCFKALETIRRYQEELESWNARKLRQQAREQAVGQLLVMLDSDNYLTRANAVRSLATLGAVEHMHRIVQMLEDPDGDVSDAARQALETLGKLGTLVSPPENK